MSGEDAPRPYLESESHRTRNKNKQTNHEPSSKQTNDRAKKNTTLGSYQEKRQRQHAQVHDLNKQT
jgi:hypothetical protein